MSSWTRPRYVSDTSYRCRDFVVKVTDEAVIRLMADEKHLRFGGTVSGPAMFGLADVAMYVAILSRIGPRH